ncbi:hypothetical protein BH09VER1_BH09VER1_03960 [soil metagenome]
MNSLPSLNILSIKQEGSLTARHYQTGEPLKISWKDWNILTAMEPAANAGEEVIWLAPGLIDLQVNGYAGIDLQSEAAVSEASLLQFVRTLRRDGCHRSLLTLITAPWARLLDQICRYRELIQGNKELRRALVGWHIEGPFLSEQPGYRGAHNPAWMGDPTPELVRALRTATGNDPVLLTVAPERANSREAIEEAGRCGFVVSLGHTNATTSQIQIAMASGATGFTHLGNGCPQQLDRHDNILWRVLNEDALTVGVIPDGIHVSPALFRIMHQAMERRQIYWTTDAMAAAGCGPGRYAIGELEVTVGEDQVVRNPATGGFAGSALSPIEGVRRGAGMLNCPWPQAWEFFSNSPAAFMGLPSKMAPGSPAGFCLLSAG